MPMNLGLGLSLPSRSGPIVIPPDPGGGVPTPPAGYTLLKFPDGSYVTTPEGNYLAAPV
ncbi:hypothetical protein SCD90_09480 [Terrihabitans sp. PJ23]|uniref:Uncharacterized protein n=2 Tax=Terrihabitans rhizophilus TaxID=3092662 RepID=A0ABU4RTZ3_9HYPH|nr:hypothetical protein [Terrihabitans sp. PJ23]